jgi:DNA primase
MFPIGDRSGRVIAFGGRVIGGDGQPKYLNSPEGPLFEKGRVLYGWSAARANANRANANRANAAGENAVHESGADDAPAGAAEVVVTEGYMDVIALHRAGFARAVAPLGTALTEMQLQELWRLSPEPVLCFDGDMAGQRAALRALRRALPLLRPGHSLRFARLPPGEDPDSLIRAEGASGFAAILAAARPMSAELWESEFAAKPVDTPERRADLETRLMEDAALIGDRTVQGEYRRFLRDRLFRLGRPETRGGMRAASLNPAGMRGGPALPGATRPPPLPRDPVRLRRALLLRALLQHPVLIEERAEELVRIDFLDPELDKLHRELQNAQRSAPQGLDAEALRQHLVSNGFATTVDALPSPSVAHAGFLSRNNDLASVRDWCSHAIRMIAEEGRPELVMAAEKLDSSSSDDDWERFVASCERAASEHVTAGETATARVIVGVRR